MISRIRNLAIAGGTFAVALGIGFYMQNDEALAARFGAGPAPVPDLPDPAPVHDAMPLLAAVEVVPGEAVLNLPFLPHADGAAAPSFQLAALGDVLLDHDGLGQLDAGRGCDGGISAMAGPAAMVALQVSAPCAPETFGMLHHQGMIFSFLTDKEGAASLIAPALTETAVFIADIPGMASLSAIVEVPDLARYDRAVLQWEGEAGMQLHALQFGADYGEPGHVWWGNPQDMDNAANGGGGFLVQLGRGGAPVSHYAEVYTIAHEAGLARGDVDLRVEALVAPGNCGRDISAQSIQIAPGAEPIAIDLTLTMPGCESEGEHLVLSDMLEDLTLAAR